MNLRYLKLWLVHRLFWLVWLVFATPVRSAELAENVTISFPTLTLSMAPWWIAKDAGIFASEGINAEVAFIRDPGQLYKHCWEEIFTRDMRELHRLRLRSLPEQN